MARPPGLCGMGWAKLTALVIIGALQHQIIYNDFTESPFSMSYSLDKDVLYYMINCTHEGGTLYNKA